VLGRERFGYDEKTQILEGEQTGTRYARGDRMRLRLAEANALTGALKFEPEDGGGAPIEHRGRPAAFKKQGGHIAGKRGRPSNIRHQGRKK
jgi:ribonuclease R